MWTPTHVQVTVHRARNLIPKGKQGTNDAYVTIQVGKEKYQTTVKEKCDNPEWHEECDLPLPGSDNQGLLLLNALHRNLFGLDEFLGHVAIPLEQFQVYECPRARWYPLKNKPGAKKAEKYRGEIEVKVTFIVQSMSASDVNLNKVGKIKRASSIKSLVGDKLSIKFPSKSSILSSGSKSDLHGEKKQLPGGTVPASPHDGLSTVFKHQEVLPTEFRAPTHDRSPEGKIMNLDKGTPHVETPEENAPSSSPQFFRRPVVPPRPHRDLLSQSRPISYSSLDIPFSTQSLTRSDPKQCRSTAVETSPVTLGAQSMLDLSEVTMDTPKASPIAHHHHMENAVQRTVRTCNLFQPRLFFRM